MEQVSRVWFTPQQKVELWERWKAVAVIVLFRRPSLRYFIAVVALALMLPAPVATAAAETAQPSESVTVTGSRREFHDFSRTLATPTKVTGKIARWERRICPVVVGQNPHFTAFIMQRVKYVALAAGAPVNTDASCKPNIEIVFTTTPQALLDNVRKNDPVYLGYATTIAQQVALAAVTRPIQAWYTTETIDLNGARSLDNGRSLGEGIEIFRKSQNPIFVSKVTRSNGNRINDGVHSGFNHILIVIDTAKLGGEKIVPLADYISMLALTQPSALDACQELPSVVNLLAQNCRDVADGLTQFDLAYLQGLYHMAAGRKATLQRSEIGALMTDRLENPR